MGLEGHQVFTICTTCVAYINAFVLHIFFRHTSMIWPRVEQKLINFTAISLQLKTSNACSLADAQTDGEKQTADQ